MPPDELKKILRDNIRTRRMEIDKTQAWLADKIGSSQAYIANIERGHTSVSVEMMARIAEALGVQPATLVTKDAFVAVSAA